MKSFAQTAIFNAFAIAIIAHLLTGVTYAGDIKTLVFAAVTLALVNAFIRPFLKILFLPINVITLGLLGWLVNVVVLYLVTVIVPGFNIIGFSLHIGQTTLILSEFWAYVVAAFTLNIATTLITWVLK